MYDKIMKTKEHLSYEGKCTFCYHIVNHKDFKTEKSVEIFNESGLCNSCQVKYLKKSE